MGAAKKIVEELKAGVSPEELARKITWKDLSGEDGDDLLAVALRLGDNQHSYNLLVYLFHISFSKDLWFSTEVLSQAVQHPNMTLLDRQAILPTMRSRLDQIKDQIATRTPTEEKLNKYWLMEATYYSVNGNLLSETGNRVEATHNYQVAQSIFEQLGLFQKAAEYKAINRRLLSKDTFKSPLPKTTPIRLHMPASQPVSNGASPSQPTSRPAEAVAPAGPATPAGSAQPAVPTPPAQSEPGLQPVLAEEKAAAPSEVLITPPPQSSAPATVPAGGSSQETAPSVPAEPAPPTPATAETSRPSAGDAVITMVMAPGPKKMAEVAPAIPEPGQVEEKVLQVPEAGQTGETADQVQDAGQPVETVSLTAQPTPEPAGAQTVPSHESPSVTGIYYPLPDVWLEDGRLHILGIEHFEGDESADLSEQIRQQCDILIGIQLQIKMYQTRRRMLDQEMKMMENKANALRSKIAKLESQLVKLESVDEAPPA